MLAKLVAVPHASYNHGTKIYTPHSFGYVDINLMDGVDSTGVLDGYMIVNQQLIVLMF